LGGGAEEKGRELENEENHIFLKNADTISGSKK